MCIRSIPEIPHKNSVKRFQGKSKGRRYFKLAIRNESLHKINNDNGVRVVNCATSKIYLSRVQCSHIATFINTLGLLVKGKCTIILIMY
jgi:hypothetical protein